MPKLAIQPRIGVRLTVRQMLIVIAALGVVLAIFRYNIGLGSVAFGVLALTALRIRRVIEESRRRGSPLTRRGRVRLLCGSLLVAMAIMSCSVATALSTYMQLGGPLAVYFINPTALSLAILASLVVCVYMRLILWPYRYPDPPCPPPPPAEESAQVVPPRPRRRGSEDGRPG
jgi:hypothetical protein